MKGQQKKTSSMVLPGMFSEPAAATPTPAATTWADVTNAARRPSRSGLAEGEQRRDRGLARAESNPDPAAEAFKLAAIRAWDSVIARHQFVTSDQLWEAIDLAGVEVPERAMVIGAIIRASAARREVKATGQFRKTARAIGHARPVAVWESLVWWGAAGE